MNRTADSTLPDMYESTARLPADTSEQLPDSGREKEVNPASAYLVFWAAYTSDNLLTNVESGSGVDI